MANVLKTIQAENNRLDGNLTKENREILTDMVVYLHSSDLHAYDIEVIRKELIGMAMEAELRNQKFCEVVGDDYKQLCTELMESSRNKTVYDRALENSHILLGGVGFLLLLEIFTKPTIKAILTSWNFVMPITLGFLISTVGAAIAAYAVYSYITHHSFELIPKVWRKQKVLLAVCIVIVFALIALCRYFLGSIVLASVHCLIPIGVIATLYILVLFLEKNARKQLRLGTQRLEQK